MSRAIIKKAAGVGSSTLLSRIIAFAREILLLQFLGVGAVSDAFFMAFRIPNTLRKVFAEGALSSVLVPALIDAEKKDGRSGVSRLTTASMLVIEGVIALFCLGVYFYAHEVIGFLAPGFSSQQIAYSGSFLKILVSFILFVSSSAILAGALQAEHYFFIPAISPAFLNVCYVSALAICLYVSADVTTFCWYMIGASILNLGMHFWKYWQLGFSFMEPDESAWKGLKHLVFQLLPCMLSTSIGEINFFIDARFASFLPSGTFSLVRYAYRFVGIPLGVFAASFAIVLLPYFSKIGNSKEKMGLYISEAIKFVTWLIVPVTLVMLCASREIFETIFFSSKFTMAHVLEAQADMNAFLVGLLFFSLEKILLNVFYALRSTNIAMLIALVSAGMNFFMDRALIGLYGGMGLALATSIAAIFRVVVFVIVLHYWFQIRFDVRDFTKFCRGYGFQIGLFSTVFWAISLGIKLLLSQASFAWQVHIFALHFAITKDFFLHGFGFWMWFGPLTCIFFIVLYFTRKFFGVELSYLD